MITMKNYLKPTITAFVVLALVTAGTAFAQTTVKETTTTTSGGTISEFGADTIVVRTETSPEPLRYSYSKTTTYVDETGTPVSVETLKSGLPVTVHYSKVGDQMVASKVIVRRAASAAPVTAVKTTTTTGVGTVSEFGPDTIMVRSTTSPEPIRYSYSKTTTYVDEDGNPVSVQTVKSGLPVTVHYTKVGDRMEANKVIVRKAVTTAAPVPVIEEKRTTTTTTTTTKDND